MTKIHIFPAGKYYIGDPCYVVDSQIEWEDLCDNTGNWGYIDAENWDEGAFEFRGYSCFAMSTRWGDGGYSLVIPTKSGFGSRKVTLGVDAGLLAVMPADIIDEPSLFAQYKMLTFDHPFEVFESQYVLFIDNMRIDTN